MTGLWLICDFVFRLYKNLKYFFYVPCEFTAPANDLDYLTLSPLQILLPGTPTPLLFPLSFLTVWFWCAFLFPPAKYNIPVCRGMCWSPVMIIVWNLNGEQTSCEESTCQCSRGHQWLSSGSRLASQDASRCKWNGVWTRCNLVHKHYFHHWMHTLVHDNGNWRWVWLLEALCSLHASSHASAPQLPMLPRAAAILPSVDARVDCRDLFLFALSSCQCIVFTTQVFIC